MSCKSVAHLIDVITLRGWFLLRDATQARPMPSCDVCVRLCVCLCVCHVREFCQNEWSYPHIFSPSGSQTILVFAYQTLRRYSYEDPRNGGSNAGRVGCNLDSQRISGFAIGNCCTVIGILHLATGFLLTAGIGQPSAMRYKQSR